MVFSSPQSPPPPRLDPPSVGVSSRKKELHNLSLHFRFPNRLFPGLLEENPPCSRIPHWEPFLFVYDTLLFLGLLQVPVMGQKCHLLNVGTCRSWCRGRACSALPQPEGTDSRADGETRESGALPAVHTGAEMLLRSWSEPISPSSALAQLDWFCCGPLAVERMLRHSCRRAQLPQDSNRLFPLLGVVTRTHAFSK